MTIARASSIPAGLETLRRWVTEEWGEIDALEPTQDRPEPLAALLDEEIVGGIAFTRADTPVSGPNALWLNALFVLPAHRRKRVASNLVTAATAEAWRFGAHALFVFTDRPSLYRALGWEAVQRGDETVLLITRRPEPGASSVPL